MHPAPDRGALRVARGAVLGGQATALAVLAHVAGGGCIDVAGAAVLASALYAGALPLLGKRRSTTWLAGWLVMAQLAGHELLALTCGTHAHDQHATAEHAVAGHAPGAGMLLAHLVGLVLSAAVLGRADAGLWSARSLVRIVARLRPVALPPLRVPDLRAVRPLSGSAVVFSSPWHAPHPARRGPPALRSA